MNSLPDICCFRDLLRKMETRKSNVVLAPDRLPLSRVQSYRMTEAFSISRTPLSCSAGEPRSVGIQVFDISILDEQNTILPVDGTSELVVWGLMYSADTE